MAKKVFTFEVPFMITMTFDIEAKSIEEARQLFEDGEVDPGEPTEINETLGPSKEFPWTVTNAKGKLLQEIEE